MKVAQLLVVFELRRVLVFVLVSTPIPGSYRVCRNPVMYSYNGPT